MPAKRGKAVTVSATDDYSQALDAAGYELAGRAEDGVAGLRLLRAVQPDLILADVVLPGLDGVSFAERLMALPLNVRPVILLARLPGCPVPAEARLKTFGAALIDKPPRGEDILNAVGRLRGLDANLPAEKQSRLEELLTALGVPAHPGRDYLAHAVALAWADRRRVQALGDLLYPEIGRRFGRAPAQVERAIRHVIEVAWRTGDMEQQQKLFGDTIDAARGHPTCGEMIAQLADILRWEG